MTARIYAIIADKARRAVAAGHCAIVDAVFAKSQERAVMKQSADALGVPFHGLFLEADIATRTARVGGRSRDASDADAAVVRIQEEYAWPGSTGFASMHPARRRRRLPAPGEQQSVISHQNGHEAFLITDY